MKNSRTKSFNGSLAILTKEFQRGAEFYEDQKRALSNGQPRLSRTKASDVRVSRHKGDDAQRHDLSAEPSRTPSQLATLDPIEQSFRLSRTKSPRASVSDLSNCSHDAGSSAELVFAALDGTRRSRSRPPDSPPRLSASPPHASNAAGRSAPQAPTAPATAPLARSTSTTAAATAGHGATLARGGSPTAPPRR